MYDHWFHFLPVIILIIGVSAYLFKDYYRFKPLIFLSLFLFVSSHVMPLGMLISHHDAAMPQTQHHMSEHACCLPAVTPTAEIACEVTCLPVVIVAHESTTLLSGIRVLADNNKSPPLTY